MPDNKSTEEMMDKVEVLEPKPEFIMCSCVLHEGVFYQGRRHGDAIILAVESSGIRPVLQGVYQGFWTSFNRYVIRAEGLLIAIESGQVQKGRTNNKDILFSEDLY